MLNDPKDRHRQAPPGPGEKEKKVKHPGLAGAAAIFDAVTEGKDFIDAVHSGLPRRLRKGTTPQGKLKDLWDHWDELDPRGALAALLSNQMEDALVGGSIGKTKRAYRKALGSREGNLSTAGLGALLGGRHGEPRF